MALKDWSTTAADNDDADATINWAENQVPSSVNNSARAMMAAIRTWYDDLEWRNLGHTVTRTGNTTFTIGADVTTTYVANRPIRCTDSSTLYGYIVSSSFSSPNTTVTVALDSGNLSASLTAVSLGPLPTNLPISVQSIRNGNSALLAGANAWTGNQTHAGTETFNGAVALNSTVTVTSTDSGASAAPEIVIDRNSSTPAAADVLGSVPFKGRDSGAGTDTYAQIQGEIVDATATSEDGKLSLQTAVAGTLATRAYVAQGLVIGSATGGDQGAGTVNATAYYVNGAASSGASAGSSLPLICTKSISAQANIDFVHSTDFDFTAYDEYWLQITSLVPAATATLAARVSINSGSSYDATAGNYAFSTHTLQSGGTSNQVAAAIGGAATRFELNGSSSGYEISSNANNSASLWFIMKRPNSTGSYRFFSWRDFVSLDPAGTTNIWEAKGGGAYLGNTGSAINGLRFLVISGGNFTCTIRVFGIKNS